jgi:hypothetical protein
MTRPISVAWCSGAFIEGARLVVDFDINTIGVRQPDVLALQKGAAPTFLRTCNSPQPGLRRPSVPQNGQYPDQALWSIVDTDRRQAKAVWGPKVH